MNIEQFNSVVCEFIQAFEGFDIGKLKTQEQLFLHQVMRISLRAVLQLHIPPYDVIRQLPANQLKKIYIDNIREYSPKTEEEFNSIMSTLNTLLRAFRIVQEESIKKVSGENEAPLQ